MASELRRGAIRIAANYTRLILYVLVGLVLTPLLLYGLGTEYYGLWGLIASAVGIGEMFREIIRECLNRELAAAYHTEDPKTFTRVYNAAVLLCVSASTLALITFGILFWIVPRLNMEPEQVLPARVFVAIRGVMSVLWIATAPALNMFIVSERLRWFNLWMSFDRFIPLVSALVIFFVVGLSAPNDSSSEAFIGFGVSNAILSSALLAAIVFTMFRLEPRTKPALAEASRSEYTSIVRSSGWNAASVTANNLHTRTDQIIMNLSFGLVGNAVFVIATQLGAYVRMVTVGMTDGLDAVSARIDAHKGATGTRDLVRHSTKLHAFTAMPAAVCVCLLAEPVTRLWVGQRLVDPEITVPATAWCARLLMIGFTVRAIADCWIKVAYGAGGIRRYAPVVLAGGISNPIIAILLLAFLPGGDDTGALRFYAPATAFAAAMLIFHGGLLPRACAKAIGAQTSDLLLPILRPAIAAIVCAPVLFLPPSLLGGWTIPALILSVGIYGASYALAAVVFIFTGEERGRVLRALHARMPQPLRRYVPAGPSTTPAPQEQP